MFTPNSRAGHVPSLHRDLHRVLGAVCQGLGEGLGCGVTKTGSPFKDLTFQRGQILAQKSMAFSYSNKCDEEKYMFSFFSSCLIFISFYLKKEIPLAVFLFDWRPGMCV